MKGSMSEGGRRSHNERKEGSMEGTRRKCNRRTRVEQVSHTTSNKGVARLSGGGCHGRHARTRLGATQMVFEGPYTRVCRLDRQGNRGQGVGCEIEAKPRLRVNRSWVAYRDVRDRENGRSHDRRLRKCFERFRKHPPEVRIRKVV